MFARAMQVKDYVCWSYAGKDANTEHLRQFSLILIQFRNISKHTIPSVNKHI